MARAKRLRGGAGMFRGTRRDETIARTPSLFGSAFRAVNSAAFFLSQAMKRKHRTS
jgi:hypothetical protein